MSAPRQPTSRTRLAVSITAHERMDVLLDQVRNVVCFCDRPLILLHINADFAGSIEADEAARRLLAVTRASGDVLVNPAHLTTGWGRILHAHISNFRHAEASGASFSHVLLLSSADLFFRPGIEAFVENHDFGATPSTAKTLARAALAKEHWENRIPGDAAFVRLLQAAGITEIHTSAHEGQYFTAALMRRLCDMADTAGIDWNHEAGYPIEEVLFPTLAASLPGLRRSERPALWLGMGERPLGRFGVAHALRLLGLAEPGSGAAMRAWIADALAEPPANTRRMAELFILSRIARLRSDPLRMLLASALGGPHAALPQAIARRLTPLDLATLDDPGRIYGRRRLRPRPALLEYTRSAPAEALLPCRDGDARHAMPACPAGSLPRRRLFDDDAGWELGGAFLAAGIAVEARRTPSGLEVGSAPDLGSGAEMTPGLGGPSGHRPDPVAGAQPPRLMLTATLAYPLWAALQGLALTVRGEPDACRAVELGIELVGPNSRRDRLQLDVADFGNADSGHADKGLRECVWIPERTLSEDLPAGDAPICLLHVKLPLSAHPLTLERLAAIL